MYSAGRSLTQNLLEQPSGTSSASRPDVVDPGNTVFDNYRDTLQYLNPSAFAEVPQSTVSGAAVRPGNVGNGAIRLPGFWNLDLSLAKRFPIKESLSLQFRAEMLNAFNHTNFTSIDNEIDSGRFGRLTRTAGARIIQLQLRLNF